MAEVNYYANLNHLSDAVVEKVLNELSFEEMCELGSKCYRFEALCVKIWRNDPIYHSNLGVGFSAYEDYYKFFICKNAANFHSLQLATSVFEQFNNETKNIELPKLKNLRIHLNMEMCEVDGILTPDFLYRCTALESLHLTQPLMKLYFNYIINIKTLKSLEIRHEDDEVDSLVNAVIQYKSHSLRLLHTRIDHFPPQWLTKDAMTNCERLEELSIDTRQRKVMELPQANEIGLDSLKTLQVVGSAVCLKSLISLVLNCRNLKELVSDEIHLNTDFVNYLMAKRTERGLETPLQMVTNDEIVGSVTYMEFA